MVTEIDLWEIKTRIKDILEADTTLADFFRNFHVGAPAGNLAEGQPMPYLFITNDEGLIEEDEEASTVQNDIPVTSKHTLHFMIAYMINEKDGPTVEKSLDDIGKTIKEVLKANHHLKDPTLNNDPMAFRSYPEETRVLNRDKIGQEIQGRVLFFKVIQYTS